MGTKRSILIDAKGIPLSVVLDGANRHDIKLLEKTLDKMVIFRPEVTDEKPQNLCLDQVIQVPRKSFQTADTLFISVPGIKKKRKKSTIPISKHEDGLLK